MAVAYILDTNIAIYLVGGAELTMLQDYDSYGVSVITVIELFGWRNLAPHEEAAIRTFLKALKPFGLTYEVRDAAIALRRTTNLKTPDAIIAATAQVNDATLLTNDAKLLNVPGLRAMSPDFKSP